MQTPQDVEAMLRLKAAGWGRRRIAKELGCSPETVRRYLKQGGWVSYSRRCRPGLLDQHRDWSLQGFYGIGAMPRTDSKSQHESGFG